MTVYADLLRYRELFSNLFRRDFQAKYKGSFLGIFWSLLNPLILLGVYFVVVGLLLKSGTTRQFPIYLIGGLACWIFFSVSLQASARSMIDSAELIKKVRFPRQLVALSMVGAQAVTFGVMTAIIIVLSVIFVPAARPTVALTIPFALLFVGFVAGVSLLAASLNALYRDVEHIITAALLPWFFLTPIVYDLGSLKTAQSHPKLLEVLRWGNPVTPPIYAFRDAMWSGHIRVADVIYLVVACVVALTLGALVFRSVDDQIAVAL